MKKVGIAILILIVLIIVALLVAPSFIDVNSFHGRIQAELQQRLGRNVTLGQLHLSLLPPAFRADNVSIGEDPAFDSSRPFAQTQQLTVHVALLPLLSKKVEVTSLGLQSPKIELIKDSSGKWNFSTIGQQQSPTSQTESPAATASSKSKSKNATVSSQPQTASAPSNASANSSGGTNAVSLNDLVITDGQVALTDEQAHQPRSVYDHIDLELKNYAAGKPFDLTAAAHLPGPNNQEVKLDGTAGPLDNATPANTPADFDVKLQNVSISGVEKFINSPALAGDDAVISGSAHIKNAANNFASTGDLNFDQVKLHGNDVGYPITANYGVSNAGKELKIDKGDIRLGSTPLAVSGTVNTASTPMAIDLKLDASNVSLHEIARLAAAAGVAFNPNLNVAGNLTAALTAQGPMTLPALNGKIDASNLNISGKDLPQAVHVNSVNLALTPSEIQSNQFAATAGSTTLNMQFAVSQYTSASPKADATIQTSNANVAEFLNIAKAYGVAALDGVDGSGTLSLNVHATGPVKNASAMTFSGDGKLENASVKTPSITQPVKIGNADLQFSQNSAIVKNLQASVGSTNANGSMTMHNFNDPQVQFALSADKVDVAQLESIFGVANASAPAKTAVNSWQIVPAADAAVVPATNAPGILERMTGTGTLAAGSIVYQGLQLTNLRSKVNMNRGVIELNPVTAQLYGGQENGTITIDARPTPMTYTVNAKLGNVDANQLLSSVSNIKQTLYGVLNANADTSFSSAGGNLARSLNGTMNLNLLNGKLAHVDILSQLANIGKFMNVGNAISPKGFTNLVKLAGTFNIRNGVAQTDNLNAVIDGGTLAGNGAVDLAAQTVNMKITAILNKAMSQSVGGTNIGGYMNTALANNQGEMVMPILVTGPLSSPHFAPDVEQLARMKLQNLLPTSANPGALTSGLLGAVMGENKTGATGGKGIQSILQSLGKPKTAPNGMPQSDNTAKPQQPQQQQQSPLQGILNNVLKKKKPPQQNPPPPQNPPPQHP